MRSYKIVNFDNVVPTHEIAVLKLAVLVPKPNFMALNIIFSDLGATGSPGF